MYHIQDICIPNFVAHVTENAIRFGELHTLAKLCSPVQITQLILTYVVKEESNYIKQYPFYQKKNLKFKKIFKNQSVSHVRQSGARFRVCFFFQQLVKYSKQLYIYFFCHYSTLLYLYKPNRSKILPHLKVFLSIWYSFVVTLFLNNTVR